MAEQQDINLSCKSTEELKDMVMLDMKRYSKFILDHARRFDGPISPCRHSKETVNHILELIAVLNRLTEMAAEHVQEIEETTLRTVKGRQSVQRPAPGKLLDELFRDSGTDSVANSQELRNSDFINMPQNELPGERDSNKDERDYRDSIRQWEPRFSNSNDINKNSQTYVKTETGSSDHPHLEERHCKDDVSEKDNKDFDDTEA